MDHGRRQDDRRALEREARLLGCEIQLDAKSYTGVILNLSANGLFVRTNADPAPGSAVRVIVRRPGGEVWEIDARVARTADRDRALVSRRGTGLEITEAPHGYHEFVASLARAGR